jgi:ribosomal protein S2
MSLTVVDNIIKPLTPQSIARYSPNRDLKNPVKPRDVTVEQLLAAGSHIGHNKSACHPAMKPFISGLLDTTHIINLDYTLAHLRRACTIVREVSFRHGVILIIGTRKGHKTILTSATDRMGAYILSTKWIPGILTNGEKVLHRGYVKEEPTAIRKYVTGMTREELNSLPPELRKRPVLQRFEWNDELKEWKGSNGEGSLQDNSATQVPTNKHSGVPAATTKGDQTEWMAWDKFASIVQDVADLSTSIVTAPQQSLHTTLAINAEYIPDHTDNWLTKQLESETQRLRQQKAITDETGDRTPIEMHKMDKFLAQKGYKGSIRGQYLSQRLERLKSGLSEYPKVKVFRDGSAMIGQQRFDKKGNPFFQYSDGSYKVNKKLYDREGKRYDRKRDSLVFSDGSELRFLDEGQERKLVVVIAGNVFDVTSTVAGSAQKREILRRAEEYFQPPPTAEESIEDIQDNHSENETPVAQLLGGPERSIQFKDPTTTERMSKRVMKQGEDDDENDDDEEQVRGSEMMETWDELERRRLDNHVAFRKKSRGPRGDIIAPPATPFDNLFTRSTKAVRPELIIVLNPRENRLALREATNNQIPTIGIVDSDCDPRCVTYSIPANDDSLRSVEYIMGVLSRAGEEGLIHRKRYQEQLNFQLGRAKNLLSESWKDYDLLSDESVEETDATVQAVSEKYCKWYGLDHQTTEAETLQKIVAQHIVLAQDEIQKLRADTTGWSMQDFLDSIKTSTQFPGVPDAVLQEMAQVQLSKSRETWAESREKVRLRDINYAPERFQERVDIEP